MFRNANGVSVIGLTGTGVGLMLAASFFEKNPISFSPITLSSLGIILMICGFCTVYFANSYYNLKDRKQ